MNNDLIKIFTGLPAKKANLIVLILTSQNIETRVEKENKSFHILVNAEDLQKARTMVEAYDRENKFFRFRQLAPELSVSAFISPTAFIIMGLLWLVHAACLHYHVHGDMVQKFGASALFILQGETHRPVTALFLHSDARHLMGNMAGILIFGAPFITLAGFGTGPFMLLFVGTLGNLLTAYLFQTAHLSIGASTAVMGAAGLLAAFQVTQKKMLRLNTLMPICAGAVLVAMFSQGERTDVWAHVFGFGCGLFSGMVFFPLNRMLLFPEKDLVALVITMGILMASVLSGSGLV